MNTGRIRDLQDFSQNFIVRTPQQHQQHQYHNHHNVHERNAPGIARPDAPSPKTKSKQKTCLPHNSNAPKKSDFINSEIKVTFVHPMPQHLPPGHDSYNGRVVNEVIHQLPVQPQPVQHSISMHPQMPHQLVPPMQILPIAVDPSRAHFNNYNCPPSPIYTLPPTPSPDFNEKHRHPPIMPPAPMPGYMQHPRLFQPMVPHLPWINPFISTNGFPFSTEPPEDPPLQTTYYSPTGQPFYYVGKHHRPEIYPPELSQSFLSHHPQPVGYSVDLDYHMGRSIHREEA